MKLLAGVVAFSAVSATSAFSALDVHQVRANVKRQLLPSDASTAGLACASSVPCKQNGCSNAVLPLVGTCGPLLGNLMAYATPDASDGHSMGIAAMMLDADMPVEMDKIVCGAWKATNWTDTCIRPTPFHAILETMEQNNGGVCTRFNEIMFEAFGIGAAPSNETEGDEFQFEPTVLPNAAEKAVISAVAGALLPANWTTALTEMGLSWADILAPVVGFLPSDPTAVVQALGGECLNDYIVENGMENETDVVVLALHMVAHPEDYATPENQTNAVMEIVGQDSVAQYAVDLMASGFPLTLLEGFMSLVMAVLQGASVDTIVALQQAFGVQVVTYALTFAGLATADEVEVAVVTNIVGTIAGGDKSFLNMTQEDQADGIFLAGCSAAGENATVCVANVASLLETALGRLVTAKTEIEFEEEYAVANITSIAMTDARTEFFQGLMPFMMSCVPMDSIQILQAEIGPYFSGEMSPEVMEQMMGLALGVGCALAENSLGSAADPSLVGLHSCYTIKILQTESSKGTLMAIMSGQLTTDIVFGLKSSTENVKTRCDEAEVAVGVFPVYVDPNAPTTAPPTAAPTVAIEAGASSLQSVAVLLVAALCFFL